MYFIKMIDLLHHPVLSKLLSLDVTLHGSLIRETISGVSLVDFIEQGGVVVCSAKYPMKVYIERLLAPLCTGKKEESSHVRYTLKTDGDVMIVLIGYFAQPSMQLFPKPDMDVNLLCLNREALYVRNVAPYGTMYDPAPLGKLMKQCKERKFALLCDPKQFGSHNHMWLASRVEKMIQKGWQHVNSSVTRMDANVDCSICHSSKEERESVKTICNHEFHLTCWRELVAHSMGNDTQGGNNIFRTHTEAKHVVCPLCRNTMKIHNCII